MSGTSYTEVSSMALRARMVQEKERIEALVRGLDPEDYVLRLTFIAVQHQPEGAASGATPQCVECQHDWPCVTYTRATGERKR